MSPPFSLPFPPQPLAFGSEKALTDDYARSPDRLYGAIIFNTLNKTHLDYTLRFKVG